MSMKQNINELLNNEFNGLTYQKRLFMAYKSPQYRDDPLNEFSDLETQGYHVFLMDHHGGDDESGGEYCKIIKFVSTSRPIDPVFVKFYGWYTSYGGEGYEGFYFVEPKTKTITVYE